MKSSFLRLTLRHRKTCFHRLPRLQIFLATLTIQVQIRRLAQTTHTVSSSRIAVIVCGAVPRAPVVPDGEIIWPPLEADLGVVVLCQEVEKEAQQEVRFVFCYAIDALGEALVYVDRFPSCYGCWKVSVFHAGWMETGGHSYDLCGSRGARLLALLRSLMGCL